MIGLLLACSVAFSTPVMASEDTSINLTENEKEQDMAQITGGEMLDLFSDEENNQLDTMAVPDKWEPNNTLETAYPYDKLPVLTTTITCSTDLYRLGMRYGSLDSPDDVDWYTVDLTANQKYFVDLRNVGETNWYIELYYSDGKIDVIIQQIHLKNQCMKRNRKSIYHYSRIYRNLLYKNCQWRRLGG